jgi:hypothetical protein
MDPDEFFALESQVVARKVCIGCPVRIECLADVLDAERGVSVTYRHGVVAGLTARERWRLDPTAPGHGDGPPPEPEDPACGSHDAMVRHLSLGERIDPMCWSGLHRRERMNHAKRAGAASPQPPSPESAPAAAPQRKTHRKPKPTAQQPPKQTAGRRLPAGVTAKERHVYRLWSKGLSDVEIARRADLSTPAVRRVRDAYGLIVNPTAAKAS